MKQTVKVIYETYFNNMSLVKNPLPKCPQAYNPHAGFKLTQYFATADEKNFEDIFPVMIAEEDFAGLQSLVSQMRKSAGNFDIKHKSAKSYCMSFLDFLDKIIAAPKKYKKIIKKMQDAYHIDGIEALADAMGGENILVKKAIAESYFFDPESAIDRHKKILTALSNNQELPARWSSEYGVYSPSVSDKKVAVKSTGLQYKGMPVIIDKDGNAQVRSLIKCSTGYTVSGGISSIFQNYKISHIWGNAYDPRYFTNLWNIVLVPSWVNDLLDKDEYAPGATPLVIKLKSTFKAVCLQHYKMRSNGYNFNMWYGTPTHLAKFVKGDYTINCICPLQQGERLSGKKKVHVKI